MVTAVIVAAGTGSRMGTQALPKQFLSLGGVPILGHTLRKFDQSPDIDQIVLVIRAVDRPHCERIIHSCEISKVSAIVDGGNDRQESVFRGLKRAHPHTEIVLIHDAVRMFITAKLITDVIHDARQYGASMLLFQPKIPSNRFNSSVLMNYAGMPIMRRKMTMPSLWLIPLNEMCYGRFRPLRHSTLS